MTALRSDSGVARARRRPARDLRLGLGLILVVGLAAWISTVAIDGVPWRTPYTVRLRLPAWAPLLRTGDEVRVGGERAGQVAEVRLAPGTRDQAEAVLHLSGVRVGPGATARVRPRGLAGAVYVDLRPGDPRRPFGSGAVVSATGSVELTDVVAGFDAASRRALGSVMTGYGTGLAGRGAVAGHVLAAAPGVLSDATAVLDAVRPAPGELAATVAGARTVAGALAAPGALPGVLAAARGVLSVTGARASQLGGTIAELPRLELAAAAVLPGADELLGHLRATAGALRPGIDALGAALPGIVAVERAAPSVGTLGRVAAGAAPDLARLTPVLGRLIGPASALRPISDPVAELAGVLIPYRTELREAPLGFTRWGDFTYGFGTGAGHRAVRFSMVFTCALARDPYPAPGATARERKRCLS